MQNLYTDLNFERKIELKIQRLINRYKAIIVP